MAPTTVSVLIPTYNRARYLAEAVNSALNQTYRDSEVIIVDDGSEDETAGIVSTFSDARVRYIYQSNRGVSAALNTAWHAARGAYCAMLGSDDVWLPILLQELVPSLDSDPSLGFVYGRARGMDPHGNPLSQILGVSPKFPDNGLKSLLYGDTVCGIACVFRRECIQRVGGFNESLVANEDWDLWIRIAEQYRFVYCNKILAQYRIHPNSLTGGKSPYLGRLVHDRVALIENYYARPNLSSDALQVESLARRNVYLDAGVRYLAVGKPRAAASYFSRAIRAHGNPLSSALRVIGVALYYLYLAKTSWGTSLVDNLVARRRKWSRAG